MKNCEILVVDDDKEDQEIINSHFENAGLSSAIGYVDNGQDALDFLERTLREKNALPKLVIMDLNMPVLNGTETLHKLKADPRYKDVSVIIFSTSENGIEKQKCLSYGARDYLIKPMTFKEGQRIMKIFASLLEEKRIEKST